MKPIGKYIAALDVAYGEDAVGAACVFFHDWDADFALSIACRDASPPVAYEPGAFYKRELPHLLRLLEVSPELPRVIVIDGYVWLSADNSPGLGAHLYEALQQRVPVIGVAKTRFQSDDWSAEVLRGESKDPLLITAVGMPLEEAREHIKRLHGAHRIPTMLKRADAEAREALNIPAAK